MRHHNARFWNEFPQLTGTFVDGRHLVVHIKNLAVAQQLSAYRRRDLLILLRPHIGEHRVTVLRRCEDRGHFPDSGHRHFQGAGNRGRRHSENIHVGAQGLDVLLVFHAKTLFLVHHHQTKVFPLHTGLQKSVSPNDNIHGAIGKPLRNFLRICIRGKAR